jgi:hypothetical protein
VITAKEMPLLENYTEILRKPTLWPNNTSHVFIMEHIFMCVKFDYCSLGTYVKKSARISALVSKNESSCKSHSTQRNIWLSDGY